MGSTQEAEPPGYQAAGSPSGDETSSPTVDHGASSSKDEGVYPSYLGGGGGGKGRKPDGDSDEISVQDAYISEEAYERAQRGSKKMKSLGWVKTGVLLCVDAIALGALSLPGAYATLGMVPGVILTVFIGILATYAGSLTGSFFLKHPSIRSYGDAGHFLFAPLGPKWARFGFEFFGGWLCLLLVFNMASHTLTGTIMWQSITEAFSVCSIVWVVISAIILFLFALPPTFTDFAWLGYIDFASIIVVIVATMIITAITSQNNPGGLAAVEWNVFPPPGTTFADAMNAVGSLVFAYSFNTVLFSLQTEMRRPQDIHKSVALVGAAQIFIYVVTGALILRFVGNDVQSPAVLSDPGVLQRIVFGLAIPVIFISGSINGNVVAKLVHARLLGRTRHRYINTFKGWSVWIAILAVECALAFVIAEAIPFFGDLLSIIAALFVSSFSFGIPAVFWLVALREGSPFAPRNLGHLVMSVTTILVSLFVLVGGLYASITSIANEYETGSVRSPFTCGSLG